jgi:hypothetical protein
VSAAGLRAWALDYTAANAELGDGGAGVIGHCRGGWEGVRDSALTDVLVEASATRARERGAQAVSVGSLFGGPSGQGAGCLHQRGAESGSVRTG